METAERTNPQHKGQKTWGLSRVSKTPAWLEKLRRYLWDLYCDDPWKGFSGRWTQPSQPCLSQTGEAPRALAAPSPSSPSHGCTWTTDWDTWGKRNNTKYCEFIHLPFPCPWHFFQCCNPLFSLQRPVRLCMPIYRIALTHHSSSPSTKKGCTSSSHS